MARKRTRTNVAHYANLATSIGVVILIATVIYYWGRMDGVAEARVEHLEQHIHESSGPYEAGDVKSGGPKNFPAMFLL